VSDEDGDAVTVLYRIGDDVTWSVLPTSSKVNVLPADLVSRLVSKPEVQKIEVTAFDGLDVSDEPVPFGVGDRFKYLSNIQLGTSGDVGLVKAATIWIGHDWHCIVFRRKGHPEWYFLASEEKPQYTVEFKIDQAEQYEGRALTLFPLTYLRLSLHHGIVEDLRDGVHIITFHFAFPGTSLSGTSPALKFRVNKALRDNTV
jgi:hypothetical protein